MPTEDLILKTKVTGISQANAALGKMDKKVGLLAKRYAKMGVLAAGAIGVLAVKRAADFEKAMTNISTLISGDATPAIEELSQGIKDMMSVIPVDADELGASAYDIVSAGISNTSDALIVLEHSAKLSVAGLGSASEATDLMTSAINAFGFAAEDSNKVADILFKTVKAGKTTVAELAQGFGKVAPSAKELGVTLEELSAATAAVTTTGLKAAEVQTGLRAVISNMNKPAKELKKIFDGLNVVTGKDLVKSSGGLVKALERIKEEAEKQGMEFEKVIGSVEGLTVAQVLLGEQNEAFIETLADMTEGTNAINEAFKKQTETAHAQWQMFKNQYNVALMELGDRILPTVTDALEGLNTMMSASRKGTEMAGDALDDHTKANAELTEAVERTTGVEQEFLKQVEFISLRSVRAYEALERGHFSNFRKMINMKADDITRTREWLAENKDALLKSGIVYKNFSDEALKAIGMIDTGLMRSIATKSEQGRQLISQLTKGLREGEGELGVTVARIVSILERIDRAAAEVGASVGAGTAFSQGGIVPGFAKGGMVEYFARGGRSRGTDIVPAMLTPGELILNTAQQKNVAGALSGVTINITGVFGTDAAEEIWDMLSDRLAESVAI